MTRIADAAEEFLRCSRIAVTGVSREPKGEASNGIYRRLRDRGSPSTPTPPSSRETPRTPTSRASPEGSMRS